MSIIVCNIACNIHACLFINICKKKKNTGFRWGDNCSIISWRVQRNGISHKKLELATLIIGSSKLVKALRLFCSIVCFAHHLESDRNTGM